MPSILRLSNVTNDEPVQYKEDIYQDKWANLFKNNSAHKNLSESDLKILLRLPSNGHECMLEKLLEPKPPEPYCSPFWDTLQCWPATPVNTTVYLSCPESIGFKNPELVAHRTCTINGTWLHGDWSNYSACLTRVWIGNESVDFHRHPDVQQALILAYIYFVTSTISLILLGITLAIFCYFRSLQCSRIAIHKNLVISFILRCIIFIVMSEPYVMNQHVSYRNVKWLCKLVTSLLQYSALANIFWMFVEGLFLHNRIVVSVFDTKAPFKLFYFLGWGIPLLITIIWSCVMHSYHTKSCWENYTKVPFIFIIYAPIIAVLLANLVFLINIIFVLVTKLRAHNTVESAQIRKAIRATIVLFPLLGITNLLFFAEAGVGGTWKTTYHISNAILQSSQGIFVTVLYCFLNGEVQNAFEEKRKKYETLKLQDWIDLVRSVITKKWRRFLENQSMKNNIRRRSSRTSSLFLSQSEVVVMMSIRGRMRGQKQLKKRDSSVEVYSPPNGSSCEVAITRTNGDGGARSSLGYNSEFVAEHEL